MPLGTGFAVFTHPSAVRAFTQGSPGARVTIMEPDGLRALPESMCAGADGRVDVMNDAYATNTDGSDLYTGNQWSTAGPIVVRRLVGLGTSRRSRWVN